jgi:hypothetical protein
VLDAAAAFVASQKDSSASASLISCSSSSSVGLRSSSLARLCLDAARLKVSVCDGYAGASGEMLPRQSA